MVNEITIYRLVSRSALGLLSRLNRNGNPRIALVYHGISPNHPLCLDPSLFRDHISYLMRRFEMVSIDETLATEGKPTVAITFDDAYANIMDYALPFLHENKITAVIYAPTAYLGTSNKWDSGPLLPIMQPADLRSIHGMGFAIGSHTRNHVRLIGLDKTTLRREIVDSRKDLEAILGASVSSFAFPYGGRKDFDSDAVGTVKKAGYNSAATTIFGRVNDFSTRFQMRRVIIWPSDTLDDLKLKVHGYYDWLIAKEIMIHLLRRIGAVLK